MDNKQQTLGVQVDGRMDGCMDGRMREFPSGQDGGGQASEGLTKFIFAFWNALEYPKMHCLIDLLN